MERRPATIGGGAGTTVLRFIVFVSVALVLLLFLLPRTDRCIEMTRVWANVDTRASFFVFLRLNTMRHRESENSGNLGD